MEKEIHETEKEYQKNYQRELYKKQRENKMYCEICQSTFIAHFSNKHIGTRKHQFNMLKLENQKLKENLT
jgi:hypothetical protein